jgi:HPt (histidine-containing phosphotransfer) domain-containing protein
MLRNKSAMQTTPLIDHIDLRADPATREFLDVIEGIDRVMGDRDLYSRMVRRFRVDYHSGLTPVRSALAAGDRTLAHRLVHTLVGAAGMIGASRVVERATQAEVALRTHTGTELADLDLLEPELLKLLELIDTLSRSGPDAATRTLPENDASLLAELIDLLASEDGGAIDLLEESAASLRAILGHERYLQVMESAQAFDYARALAALRRQEAA